MPLPPLRTRHGMLLSTSCVLAVHHCCVHSLEGVHRVCHRAQLPYEQVSISKEATIIQGDGSTQKEVEARVKQIRNLAADTEQEYEKEKLNERIARLSGGVAVIQREDAKDQRHGVKNGAWLVGVLEEGVVVFPATVLISPVQGHNPKRSCSVDHRKEKCSALARAASSACDACLPVRTEQAAQQHPSEFQGGSNLRSVSEKLKSWAYEAERGKSLC
eukprot:1161900-Pelagomonas_calceolata.AAC.3